MTARAAFHIAGLRWIGSLFDSAAERLESHDSAEPLPLYQTVTDPAAELRARLQERYF